MGKGNYKHGGNSVKRTPQSKDVNAHIKTRSHTRTKSISNAKYTNEEFTKNIQSKKAPVVTKKQIAIRLEARKQKLKRNMMNTSSTAPGITNSILPKHSPGTPLITKEMTTNSL